MRPKAVKVNAIENFNLKVEFDNGEVKIFDVKPYLNHKAFEALKDENQFKLVEIDGLSIKWACGADICPDELYNLSTAM